MRMVIRLLGLMMLPHAEHMLAHAEHMLAHDEHMLAKICFKHFFELIYIMGDSQPPQPIDQQVTSKDPAKRIKNPKKVAAGLILKK